MPLYREFCDDVAARRSWKNRSSKVGKVRLLSQANDIMTHNEKNKRMRVTIHRSINSYLFRSVLMLLQYKSII